MSAHDLAARAAAAIPFGRSVIGGAGAAVFGLALVAALLVACDEPPDAPALAPDPMSPEETRAALIGYLCEQARTCPARSANDLAFFTLVRAGVDCEAYLDRGSPLAGFTSLHIGRAQFADCAARSIARCRPFEELDGCQTLISGERLAGEPCAGPGWCAPNHFCGPVFVPRPGQCSAACQPLVRPGGACIDDLQCRPADGRPAYCSAGGRCRLRTIRQAEAGAPCGLIDDDVRVDCATGSACVPQDEGAICVVRPGADEACVRGVDCLEGTFCLDGVCRRVELAENAGDACPADAVVICDPVAGLSCTDGVCALDPGAVGAECMPGGDGACQAGLHCGPEGLCRLPLDAGAPCTSDAECGARAFCDAEGAAQAVCAPEPLDPCAALF